jgi:hypothetical protein
MARGAPDWQRFAGIRVIGDVHGNAEPFAKLIAEARARHLFVVQLGDLVDRGPDSVGALRLAFDLIDRSDGLFLRSNHDDKLRRALIGNPVRVGPNLQATLDALAAAPDSEGLRRRLLAALAAAPWWLQAGDYLMAHGGFHPLMLTAPGPWGIEPRRTAEKCRALALYGETQSGADEEAPPIRTYAWLDTVPAGITVLIGHDVVAMDRIVERQGVLGGRVLFCDTGSGFGGPLSFVDLPTP